MFISSVNKLLRRHIAVICWGAVLGISLVGSYNQAKAQTTSAPVGSGAWYQMGRTFVNYTTGQGFAYGYYTQIAGLTGSLFSGAPGPSTAYFTFRTSIFTIVPVQVNGDIYSVIAEPDTFNVYLNTSPNANWGDPDSFSSGQIVATFSREQFLLYREWESFGTEYATLTSSEDFTFNGVTVNIGNVLAAATITSTYSNTPIAGPAAFPSGIAFAGNAMVAAPRTTPAPGPVGLQRR